MDGYNTVEVKNLQEELRINRSQDDCSGGTRNGVYVRRARGNSLLKLEQLIL